LNLISVKINSTKAESINSANNWKKHFIPRRKFSQNSSFKGINRGKEHGFPWKRKTSKFDFIN